MVIFGQKSLYSSKSGRIRVKRLSSCKVVLFGQNRMYSVKSGCVLAKVVVLGKKWLCSGQSASIRAKLSYSDKRGYIRAKWLYSGKSVVVGKSGYIRAQLL